MRRIQSRTGTSLLLGCFVAAGLGVAANMARAQQDTTTPASVPPKEAVANLLREFVAAAEKNDLQAALKTVASEEDLKSILDEEAARKASREMRSRVELSFHEFHDALQAFGKHDIYQIFPGRLRSVKRGEMGNKVPITVAEGGYVSFARDSNYLIEMRFNIGGLMMVKPDQWVITNLAMRTESPK